MIRTQFVFDWRQRVEGNKEGPVDLRVTYNRKAIYICTGVRVRRSEWKHGMVVNREDADDLMKMLRAYERHAVKAAGMMADEDVPIEGGELKRRVKELMTGQRTSSTDMLEWIKEQVPAIRVKDGTRKHYVTLVTRLEQFGKLVKWTDLTVERLYMWDAWLHELKKPMSDAERKSGMTAQPISDGGVYTYHKCLKALLNRAVEFDKIDRNPYDRLRGKFKRGDKERVEYLTDEEMAAVESLHPVRNSEMAVVRDLFVFQMHTGLSYADTQAFNFKEYQKVNDRWVNVGKRVKTGVEYIVVLSDECLEILKRYGWKLPKMENSKYNLYLKHLGQAVGIEKPLHTHLARHSFATKMTASGVPIQNVAKMLGHTNIAQTQRYAKVLTETVMADFERVNGGHDGIVAYKEGKNE